MGTSDTFVVVVVLNVLYEIHKVIAREHNMYKEYARQVSWLFKSEEIE
jgi:hypothetical protein